MPSFLIHFAHDLASTESEKALQLALSEAGFFDTIVGSNHLEYRLPRLVYHTNCSLTKDQILDRAKRIALRSGKPCAIMVTECADTAWVGLELVGRERSAAAAHRAATQPEVPETPVIHAAAEPTPRHKKVNTGQ